MPFTNNEQRSPCKDYIFIYFYLFYSCLVKRGADINIEDKFSMRADDIAGRCDNNECRDLIRNLQHQRCIMLSQYVRKVS